MRRIDAPAVRHDTCFRRRYEAAALGTYVLVVRCPERVSVAVDRRHLCRHVDVEWLGQRESAR